MPAAGEDVSRATTQPASQAQPLKIFDWVIGSWRGDGRWANGEHLHTRVVYDRSLNGQLIDIKSFVVKDGQEPSQVYQTFAYFHPKEQAIRFVSISNGGGVYEGTVTGSTKELHFVWSAYLREHVVEYKQTLAFVDDETYQWTVWQKAGDEWKQIIESQLRRERDPGDATTAAKR